MLLAVPMSPYNKFGLDFVKKKQKKQKRNKKNTDTVCPTFSYQFLTDLSLSVTISLKRCTSFPVRAFHRNLLLSCCCVTEKFIQEKYEGCKLMMNRHESKKYSLALSI